MMNNTSLLTTLWSGNMWALDHGQTTMLGKTPDISWTKCHLNSHGVQWMAHIGASGSRELRRFLFLICGIIIKSSNQQPVQCVWWLMLNLGWPAALLPAGITPSTRCSTHSVYVIFLYQNRMKRHTGGVTPFFGAAAWQDTRGQLSSLDPASHWSLQPRPSPLLMDVPLT